MEMSLGDHRFKYLLRRHWLKLDGFRFLAKSPDPDFNWHPLLPLIAFVQNRLILGNTI